MSVKEKFALLLLPVFLAGCVTMERLDGAVSSAEKLMEDTIAIATRAPEGGLLTKEEAERIALDHAGLTRAQVRSLKTEYDFDGGRHLYEVEFCQGTREFSYEIDAETGSILGFGQETEA